MPQTEFESTITGRNSRASNFSNGSRGTYRRSIRPRADSLAAAPGVQSMLKTSTEIGNVGSLAAPGVRSPPFRSGVHQRHGASSRMSTGSAQSQQSKRTSYHHTFPSVSSTGRRCSMTKNVLSPSFDVQPDFKDMSDPTVLPPQPAFLKDSCRSYSLTNTSRHPSFPNYRSLTSLRSHDPVQRPRSPYRYPTRLKRPGYRPSSPAMSDVTGLQQSRLQNPVAVKHKVVLPQPSMPFTKHPNQQPAFRNRCTPFVNVVERLEQKALLFPVARKSSPALTDKASLSVLSKTRGQTPSDGPSSDPPSSTPPTPRDIVGTTPKITIAAPVVAPIPFPSVSGKGPMYYDYGEDFEQFEKHVTQVYEETTSSPIPMGFVHRIKALLEERAASSKNSSPISQSRYSLTEKTTEPNIPELPASPVLKRITREMILAAIGPVSDIADSEVTIKVDESDDATILPNQLSPVQPIIAELPADNNEMRKSTLSVPDSIASALTSSTPQFEYALRYSMPVSMASLQSSRDSIPCHGDEEIRSIEQDAIQEMPSAEHGNSEYPMKRQHSTLNLVEGTPIAELAANKESPIAQFNSSSPFVSSSRHSIPTSYTAAPSSEAVRTPGNSSDYARAVAVAIESEKEVVCSHSTPRTGVHHMISKIDDHEGCSPIHSQSEEVPCSIAGSVSPISTLIATENSPTACRDSVSTTHLSVNWSYRKPIPSSTTPVDSPKDSSSVKRNSVESTTDLRFSSYQPHAVQLPDLKEESETSLDRNSNVFRFPRPGSGVPLVPIDKIRRNRDPLSPRVESAHNSAFKPHHAHSLSETRGIPSLQFSQINLFAKLNDAFESRHRSSMDGYAIFVAPTPERSDNTDNDMIREKYRSLFGSLDAENEPEEHFDDGNSQHEGADEQNEEFSRHATVAFTAPTLRPLSPDELIAEVDRISIPSINGLTQRLSEFLPSLKKYYQPGGETLDEEAGEEEGESAIKDPVDEAVEVTINEIRSIGKELESENSKTDLAEEDYAEPSPSKSYKLRPVSADIRPKSTPPEKRPVTPLNLIQQKLIGENTHLAELDTPTPAALRSRSLSDSNLDGPSHHIRIPDAVCTSRHPLIGRSPPESRPWNLDTSYPWAYTNPDIAIVLPATTHRKSATKPAPSPLRLRISSSSRRSSSRSGTSATLQASAHRPPSSAGDPTCSTADTFQPRRTHPQRGPGSGRAPPSAAATRKPSKRTLLGSLSRRIGLARSHSAQSQPAATTGTAASAPAAPASIAAPVSAAALAAALPPGAASPPPADPARPVDPGDRYPTSALLSPAGAAFAFAFAFDGEARSFFSEESSVGGRASDGGGGGVRVGRLRRRITAWRGKAAPAAPVAPLGGQPPYECVDAMGRTEVRARRLLERVKALWYRGGEILRTMSLRAGRRVEEDGDGMSWLERVLVRSEEVNGLESALGDGSIAACAPSSVEINEEVGSEHTVQEEDNGDVVEVDGNLEGKAQQ